MYLTDGKPNAFIFVNNAQICGGIQRAILHEEFGYKLYKLTKKQHLPLSTGTQRFRDFHVIFRLRFISIITTASAAGRSHIDK